MIRIFCFRNVTSYEGDYFSSDLFYVVIQAHSESRAVFTTSSLLRVVHLTVAQQQDYNLHPNYRIVLRRRGFHFVFSTRGVKSSFCLLDGVYFVVAYREMKVTPQGLVGSRSRSSPRVLPLGNSIQFPSGLLTFKYRKIINYGASIKRRASSPVGRALVFRSYVAEVQIPE